MKEILFAILGVSIGSIGTLVVLKINNFHISKNVSKDNIGNSINGNNNVTNIGTDTKESELQIRLRDLDESRRLLHLVLTICRQGEGAISPLEIASLINALQYHSHILNATQAEEYQVMLSGQATHEVFEKTLLIIDRVNEEEEQLLKSISAVTK